MTEPTPGSPDEQPELTAEELALGRGRVEPVGIDIEMQRSYLDYAMSVIVSRALPDVRDGLKPVHRKILWGMFDGGYLPDRSHVKCARVVGDVMGNYHPHGDLAIYDALVRMGQPWSLRYPLVDGSGNFGSPGNDRQAAMRYTECRLAPLTMAMLQDIREDTVDFTPNYDGRSEEPVVLPSRLPNLLVNGSEGIAVGMATRIPPHNLREIAAAVQWCLSHPDADEETTLAELLKIVKGPDFPTHGLIVGTQGIQDAYRTGRGSIGCARGGGGAGPQGPHPLVVKQLPYQVNPDNLAQRTAELVKEGKIAGIADIRDESSGRTGMRIVMVLKRDAIPKVVLNNLYKHTQLQETFGANMLALVDGVPRTLNLAQFVRYYVDHQIEVIQRRTRFRLRKAEERAHILRGYVKALDMLDEVIALIRRSPTVGAHRSDAAAGGRRRPGHRHPRPAAAPAGRAGAAADHRRAGRDRAADRRPEGRPGQAGAAAADRLGGADRADRTLRGRAADRDRPVRRRRHGGRPDRPRRRGRDDHPHRVRQAHARRPAPSGGVARVSRRDPPPDDIISHFFVCSTRLIPSSPARAGSTGPRRTSCRASRSPQPARGEPAGVPAGRHIPW